MAAPHEQVGAVLPTALGVDKTADRKLHVLFFRAEDGIRDGTVTGVQTCALPIWRSWTAFFAPISAMVPSAWNTGRVSILAVWSIHENARQYVAAKNFLQWRSWRRLSRLDFSVRAHQACHSKRSDGSQAIPRRTAKLEPDDPVED